MLCERSHFVRHNAEAAACFAGPCSLNCRIQRKKIRWVGHFVVDVHHGRDMARVLIEALYDRSGILDSGFELAEEFDGLANGSTAAVRVGLR